LPSVSSGGGGRFLGFARADLAPIDAARLVRLDWIGLAAFALPFALALIRLAAVPARAAAALLLLGIPTLYGFAPALGLPSTSYYIRGIDPASMTFPVAIAGALAFAVIAPRPGERAARATTILAATLIGVNAVLGVPTYVSPPPDAAIVDTQSPFAREELAHLTVPVDGNDLSHRVMPLTADEAVGFTYRYRTPMLRDYYDQGQVHPDWISWAFTSLYDPPLDPPQARAVVEWFAVDRITVPVTDPDRARALAALDWLRGLPPVGASPYREFAVLDPATIVGATLAPLAVVIADDGGYDRALRLLMSSGAWPRTRLVVHLRGALADLPSDLAATARAVLVVGDRVGDAARAANVLRALGSRGAVTIVWDVGDLPAQAIPQPWPVTALATRDIAAWDVVDRPGRIGSADFSPARYGDGPWRATVPNALREGAAADLTLDGAPLIASGAVGNATVTVVGGNLFYHALTNANAREAAYLASLLGPATAGAEREPDWSFVDPDTRVITTDGTPLVIRESFHPNWRATLRTADGSTRDLAIREAGPGVMAVIPQGTGTVRLEFGPSGAEMFSWALFAAGIAALVALARRRLA
ncbi:MAG TPA: hypothetical protein VJQ09_00685, partial [Candidatus Limnocylindria bacterium]|nr:hypothetical protein [Candidatus Limnocylindria bacterium]